MEDGGTAIVADDDVMEPASEIESWLGVMGLAGHAGERSGWSCNKSIRMADPNSDRCPPGVCGQTKIPSGPNQPGWVSSLYINIMSLPRNESSRDSISSLFF